MDRGHPHARHAGDSRPPGPRRENHLPPGRRDGCPTASGDPSPSWGCGVGSARGRSATSRGGAARGSGRIRVTKLPRALQTTGGILMTRAPAVNGILIQGSVASRDARRRRCAPAVCGLAQPIRRRRIHMGQTTEEAPPEMRPRVAETPRRRRGLLQMLVGGARPARLVAHSPRERDAHRHLPLADLELREVAPGPHGAPAVVTEPQPQEHLSETVAVHAAFMWRTGTPDPFVRSAFGRLALGCRIGGRKESVDPGLPHGGFPRGHRACLRAVEVETNGQTDLAAHHDGE